MTARPFIAEIQQVVAAHYGLERSDLMEDRRVRHIAHPRHLAMFLAREMTARSYPEIGRMFGGRDHSTVQIAVRKAADRVRRDRDVEADYVVIRRRIEDAVACRLGEAIAA